MNLPKWPFPATRYTSPVNADVLHQCSADWCASRRLQLNASKTELICMVRHQDITATAIVW